MNMAVAALRASLLDGAVYEEAGQRPEWALRSLAVVSVAGVAFGLSLVPTPPAGAGRFPPLVVLLGLGTFLMAWLVWAVVVHLVGGLIGAAVTGLSGGRLRHRRPAFRTTLRAVGMAFGPAVLMVGGPLPAVGNALTNVALIWTLACGVAAVRHVHGLPWPSAALVAGLGWLVAVVFLPFLLLAPPQ